MIAYFYFALPTLLLAISPLFIMIGIGFALKNVFTPFLAIYLIFFGYELNFRSSNDEIKKWCMEHNISYTILYQDKVYCSILFLRECDAMAVKINFTELIVNTKTVNNMF